MKRTTRAIASVVAGGVLTIPLVVGGSAAAAEQAAPGYGALAGSDAAVVAAAPEYLVASSADALLLDGRMKLYLE